MSFINDTSSVNVSSASLLTTLPCDSVCITWPVWTFVTSDGSRIKITFNSFHFEDHNGYIEISESLNNETTTRLFTRYSGTEAPGNVISISNAAYIVVQALCTLNKGLDFNLKITTETDSG